MRATSSSFCKFVILKKATSSLETQSIEESEKHTRHAPHSFSWVDLETKKTAERGRFVTKERQRFLPTEIDEFTGSVAFFGVRTCAHMHATEMVAVAVFAYRSVSFSLSHFATYKIQ